MGDFSLQEPYEARPFRFLELWSVDSWQIKVYGITCRGEVPDEDLVAAAKRAAISLLAERPLSGRGYGVGFLGVHQGRGENFVFLDRWADENELHHQLVVSASTSPERLVPASPEHSSVCVWDLHLQNFERQAWLDCVLANPAGPDLAAYLARRLRGEA